MVERRIEADLLPVCRKNGVSVLSYSSLALGLLSGRMGPDRVFSGDDQRKDNPRFSLANRERVARLMADIEPVAEAHAASLAQVVIAWTLSQPGVTFALCGARDPDQARENAKAARLRLSAEEVEAISQSVERHLAGTPT